MNATELPSNLQQDIRSEQVRLVFRSMKSSLFLGSALALILTMVFHNEENHIPVLSWLAAVFVSRVLSVGYAHIALRRGINAQNTSRHIQSMCLIKVLEGLAWGSLVWIVMGHASLAEQLLAMASLAGVSGNAVSLLAPVFPWYLSMQLAQLAAMSSRLLTLEDSAFAILTAGCALFVTGQSAQALLAQRNSRETLMLRFENLDLIERLKVESENAEQARRKAEEANLAKSKFLAAASHDLRQPVHAQELFLEVLARSDLSDFQHKTLNNARAASQASAQMLNTLLDFSRIEAGVIEPQPCAFQLQPLFNKLENELGSQVDSKYIFYRCRETRLAVYSDPNLLELMLRNLITNAIRYTHQGGLLIGCRKRGDKVVIEVFDTGIGIEPSQQREIFREFHQLGNPERDRLKGLGLGLAITQGLAQSLDHQLTLSSRPGRGSVFRISLPLATSSAKNDTFTSSRRIQLQIGLLRGLRILIIEDDAMARQAITQLLVDWGCNCKAVEHTNEALELVQKWQPQLLISDYRLRENQTGAVAIARIREIMGTVIPALIITGDTAPERLREALKSGLKLLHKPVPPPELYQALAKIVSANNIELNQPPSD
ncbi:hybrid sensor histidine kinase/response regulator [Pseudomonas mendocina]|nr:hybrid sensor histidine kinase/response regulator [Pseudomonas mendocina]MDV5862552.1 hybrid sensor histidine kinase/response regulator [Pseudomonas mendocina]